MVDAKLQCSPPSSGLLASHETFPVALTISFDYAYWINLGNNVCGACVNTTSQIRRCSVCGCDDTPETIAEGLTYFDQPPDRGILVADSSDIFFKLVVGQGGVIPALDAGTVSASIGRCPLAGCGLPTQIVQTGEPVDFAVVELFVDKSDVFWVDEGAIKIASKDGSGLRTLWISGAQAAYGLTVDDSDVYWTATAAASDPECIGGGCIMRCNKAGCDNQPDIILTNVFADWEITNDESNIYWIDNERVPTSIATCSKAACASTTVVMDTSSYAGFSIVSDGDRAYWTGGPIPTIYASGHQLLYACDKGGCNQQPTIIASDSLGIASVAVDAANVYWTNIGHGDGSAVPTDGQVRVIAK